MSETWKITHADIFGKHLASVAGYSGSLRSAFDNPDIDFDLFVIDPKVVTRFIPGPTDSLCINPNERRIVFFAPAKIASNIRGLLIPVGYSESEIQSYIAEETLPLSMIVTNMDSLNGQLFPATWKNLCDLAEKTASPENSEEIAHIQFARTNYPGKSYAYIESLGSPFNQALPTFVKIAGIKSLFRGDGFSQIDGGPDVPHRPEYIMFDKPKNSIPHIEIDLRSLVRPKLPNI